ncbi:MAG: hypothetical protein H0W76_08005 [Pyrinomonadaceae bacterium]|nr:hypothetical protein [Pyrinomonadaceae bacterium]
MNEVDETKSSNGRGAPRQTRRFEISLPIVPARVVEAAATLGGYDTPEAFIQEAALKAAEEFQQRLQHAISRDNGHGKGRKAGTGATNES